MRYLGAMLTRLHVHQRDEGQTGDLTMTTTTERDARQALLGNVLAAHANAPSPRMREVTEALVRHLHAFVDEIEPTQAEWMAGVQFLTAVGQFSNEARQEMILLSDVLGVSSLVEMMNYGGLPGSTENTVLGPFYIPDSPRRENGDSIIVTEDGGQRLHVAGVVRSLDGRPLPGATVDIWQGASNGLYPVQDPAQDPTNLRGVFTTDSDGRYSFITQRPMVYPVPVDGPVGDLLRAAGRHPMRAAHVHFMVSADGHHPVTTHFFDSKSEYLDTDAVFGVRDSLILDFEERADGDLAATFDITLTPAG
jgi:catechol 1,2-dioxygenase